MPKHWDSNRVTVSKYDQKEGELITTVEITKGIKEKTIFIPISNREINYLTSDILDREFLQPDYNHSAVVIEKIEGG
jgi:ferredoxin-nitrate reductase